MSTFFSCGNARTAVHHFDDQFIVARNAVQFDWRTRCRQTWRRYPADSPAPVESAGRRSIAAGSSGGMWVSTEWSRNCRCNRVRTTPMTSSIGCKAGWRAIAPASSRVISSRFATRRFSRSDSSRIDSASSCRAVVVSCSSPSTNKLARTRNAGQRRALGRVTRHSAGVLRNRSGFHLQTHMLGFHGQIPAFDWPLRSGRQTRFSPSVAGWSNGLCR